MTSYLVTRDVPGQPRQYIRRIAGKTGIALWTASPVFAMRFSERDAILWRDLSRARSKPRKTTRVMEPIGEYDIQEVQS